MHPSGNQAHNPSSPKDNSFYWLGGESSHPACSWRLSMAAPGGQGVLTFSEAPWLTPTALLSPHLQMLVDQKGLYQSTPEESILSPLLHLALRPRAREPFFSPQSGYWPGLD